MVSSELEPLELAFFRWGGLLVLLLPYLYGKRAFFIHAIKTHFKILVLLSILGITSFNTLLYYGLQETTATNALLINSSIPILIILFNAIFFREKLEGIQVFGIILSTVGVIFLVVQGEFTRLIELQFNQGDLWIIASSLTWACYSVLLRFRPKTIKGFEFIALITLLGFVILAMIFFGLGYRLGVVQLNYSASIYGAILYTILFASLLSFLFWNHGVESIGANKTGQFTHLMPIFGAILAYFILGERLYTYHYYGIIFIALGLYLTLGFKKEKDAKV